MQELYMRSERRLNSGGYGHTPWQALGRIGIGLVQGLALYVLWRSIDSHAPWVGSHPRWVAGLGLLLLYTPLVVLVSVGRLRLVPLILWSSFVALTLFAMGAVNTGYESSAPYLAVFLVFASAGAVFIAQHLFISAAEHQQTIAPYPAYFENAWKAGVQIGLSLMFVGAFWLILHLGSALFSALGLDGFRTLINDEVFKFPVSFTIFAIAVHLTDVREGLIQGIRSVALMLLSWLLPLAVLLAAAFLAALPFTGLTALKASFSPAALMLSAAAGLIILGNTVYQDGEDNLSTNPVLRLSLRVVGVLLVPLVGIATWALLVRIGQHGLTPDRIVGLTCALIGLIYAAGYVIATFVSSFQNRSSVLEMTNLVGAAAAVLAVLAHSTPWLNPIRLTVDNQVDRLITGKVKVEDFSFTLLRYNSGKYGQDALKKLGQSSNPEVALAATPYGDDNHSLSEHAEANRDQTAAQRASLITFLPEGTAAPEGFMEALKSGSSRLPCPVNEGCVARIIDISGDRKPEVLLIGPGLVRVWAKSDQGRWIDIGTYTERPVCKSSEINTQDLKSSTPQTRSFSGPLPVEIAGRVFDFTPEPWCTD